MNDIVPRAQAYIEFDGGALGYKTEILQEKIYSSIVTVVVIVTLNGSITTRRKYNDASSMDCREWGSHARGVFSVNVFYYKSVTHVSFF